MSTTLLYAGLDTGIQEATSVCDALIQLGHVGDVWDVSWKRLTYFGTKPDPAHGVTIQVMDPTVRRQIATEMGLHEHEQYGDGFPTFYVMSSGTWRGIHVRVFCQADDTDLTMLEGTNGIAG